MERLLSEIVEKLQKAHGAGLVSVLLYGSAAMPEGRDPRSDYNILCVLKRVTPAELRQAEPVFRWWREMKNPAPLLLSEDEVRTSADSFPVEFHDICEKHVVLFGIDVVGDIQIDDRFYRAQLEHELRSKVIRLRQKAAGVLSEKDLLLALMADSVSTFCVLFRHVLRLSGDQPRYGKREVIAACSERFEIPMPAFQMLLDLREEKIRPRAVRDAVQLLTEYLHETEVIVMAVDRISE